MLFSRSGVGALVKDERLLRLAPGHPELTSIRLGRSGDKDSVLTDRVLPISEQMSRLQPLFSVLMRQNNLQRRSAELIVDVHKARQELGEKLALLGVEGARIRS
jgi:hypothetical protein